MTTISLPEHLHSALWALLSPSPLPPEDLTSEISRHVKEDYAESTNEIPFDVVFKVSRWAQQNEAQQALRERELNPRDYDRITLLAGTITSPSSRLPPDPVVDPYAEALQGARDRKAIAALVNGVFSVGGVGFAAWWAAGNIGWKPESRALLSVFASIVVAISEGVLYLIWQQKRDGRKRRIWRKGRITDKKLEGENEVQDEDDKAESADEIETDRVRKRAIKKEGSPGESLE